MIAQPRTPPIAKSPAKTAEINRSRTHLFRPLFAAAVVVLALASGARAESLVTVDGKSREVEVLRVAGEGVVVRAAEGEKLYRWRELEAKSAYGFYKRRFAAADAKGRLKVGRFCLRLNLFDEAKAELVEATRLDPSLKGEVDRIWAEGQPERPALTPEETKAVLAEQRGRGKKIEEAVGEPVFLLETDHFIIYTTFPAKEHAGIKSLCEKLYRGLDRIFEITKNKDRMWDGKGVLYFFKDQAGFAKFASKVHGIPGQVGGGYFVPRLAQCEVVIPNVAGGDWFKETMVHEGTHAFLHFYRSTGRVPRWVQEGTAQYFEFEEFPEARVIPVHKRIITAAVKSGKILSIADLQESDRPKLGSDIEGYAWCYNYVSYLIHKDARKYADFIRGMKSGLDPEEALKKAYDFDFDGLQQSWLKATAHLKN